MSVTNDLQSWAAAYREAGQAPEALKDRVRAAVDADASRRPWAAGLFVGALLGAAALALLIWATGTTQPAAESGATPLQAPYEGSHNRDDGTAIPRDANTTPRSGAGDVPNAAEPSPPADAPAADTSPATTGRPAADTSPAASVPHPGNTPSAANVPSAADRAPPDNGRSAADTPPAANAPRAVDTSPGGADLESLRRLRAAERLLQRRPTAARAKLEAHKRDYPDSPVAIEREALWIRAACLSGGAPGLERRRAAFAKRSDVAAYRKAIRRDCD